MTEEPYTYVIHGTPTGHVLTGAQLQAGIGGFVIEGQVVDARGGGDVDGDGLHDIILGADDGLDGGNIDGPGAVLVAYGQEDTAAVSFAGLAAGHGGFMVAPDPAWRALGTFVDMGGDFDGDGLDDLVFGGRVGEEVQPGDSCGEPLDGRTMIRLAPSPGGATSEDTAD